MYKWLDPASVVVPADLQDFVGGHSLVAQTLVRRGIISVAAARAFLDPDAYTPAPPQDFPNLLHAVERLETAIRQGERVCVWGDFDVDGQTSTTLLVSALRALDANVTYHIPVRATESHGVHLSQLTRVIAEGAQLLLTCDTGIDAHEAVAYANAHGVDVIITDHHELPPTLPDTYAIVNTHLLPVGHPLATLPGVGVAYKVAEELASRAGRPAAVTRYLDLVALGIVADVAEQTGDARYLLQRGLDVLRNTTRLGPLEMMKLAHLNPAQLTEENIAFALAPRMNALGRLADANVSVEFLTTDDLTQARILATQLEALNNERKRLCEEVAHGAEAQLARDPALLDYGALVLTNPHWPAGVIGIVASRLVEQYNRPALLIATPEGELGHGSARSVAGVHITEALATQADLLASFGGHAMAAGLALSPENIPALRRGLSRAVLAQRGEVPPSPTLHIDGYLALADLSLELVADLGRLGPFGAGNPPLTLATRDVTVQSHSKLGRDGNHQQLVVEDAGGATQRVLWWRSDETSLPEGHFDLAYTVGVNTFRGNRSLQVTWVDARQVAAPAVVVEVAEPALEVVDYRREPHPLTLLKPLLAEEDVQVWAEGVQDAVGRPRRALEPAATLVIWTAPPGPGVLQAALERVAPRRVVLFGVDPGLDTLEAFLKRLMGLVKYALRAGGGRLQVAALAEATAQRQITVRQGIAWLAAKGHLTVQSEAGDEVEVSVGGTASSGSASGAASELRALLDETAAYRRHFAKVEKECVCPFTATRANESHVCIHNVRPVNNAR